MNKVQNKVLNMVQKCQQENPSEPVVASVLIRWNDGMIIHDNVSIGDVADFPDVDVYTAFSFDDAGNMVMCTTPLDFDESDFETYDDYITEVNKYTESQEDLDHYFNSPEDFIILDIYEALPASEY